MISYPPHTSSQPSPRQLQGPRPTPLKVRKDSYKISKKAPPAAAAAAAVPPNNPHVPLANPQQPPRPPVIIYTVSPKIIHTNPSEFMSLVQRLTGPDSPSARLAAIQTAHKFSISPRQQQQQQRVHVEDDDDGSSSVVLMADRGAASASTTGILSPMPSSLQPISSSFFSSSSMSFDAAGTFGFLQEDLSPGPNAGFFISPHMNLLSTPTVPSPGAAAWDHIFNHF